MDFIYPEFKQAFEHKLVDFSKYSEKGSLILNKLRYASTRVVVQPGVGHTGSH